MILQKMLKMLNFFIAARREMLQHSENATTSMDRYTIVEKKWDAFSYRKCSTVLPSFGIKEVRSIADGVSWCG